MSKIEELIKDLCLNGVEYRKLGDISNFRRGSFPQPYGDDRWYDGENSMPFVQVADVANNMKLVEYTKNKISQLAQKMSVFVPAGTIIVTLQGTIGRVAITQYDSYVDRTLAIFEKIDSKIVKKYFVYQLHKIFELKKETARGSTIKTITKEEFTEFKIPIPPIEIQNEIVRILDKFMRLEAELEAELGARRKQYEYYRNELLNFNVKFNNMEYKRLNQIVNFKNGKGHEKNIDENGKYIVVNSKFISANGEKVKFSNEQLVPLYINDILIVMSDLPNGRALARAFIVEENNKYTLNQRIGCFSIIDKNNILPRYLFYIINRNKQLLKYDNGSDQTNLRKDEILSIEIPVPILSEQERIVNILDKFDKLVNDISEGLPAEIEARRKQYEYYKNKLLTFKEIEGE